MHHCLSVPEIVNEITSHCNESSLARLARTARLFDCALDNLWTTAYAERLIECFSMEVAQWSQDREHWTLLSHPEPRHWERFHFYAKRVKWIELYHLQLGDALIDLLCLSVLQGDLLPLLRTCSLHASHLSHLRVLQPFSSLRLNDLYLTFEILSDSYREEFLQHPDSISFFASLPDRFPELSILGLHFFPENFFRGLPTFFWSFPNLTGLETQIVDGTFFPLIASLPQLTRLTLFNPDDSMAPSQEPPTNMCRSLQYLNLSLSLSSIRTLFGFISRCPMEEIQIYIQDDSWTERDSLDQILLLICDKCERLALSRLTINGLGYDRGDRTIQANSLLPLFEFPNIVKFTCPLCKIDVADRHISMLAKSWPKLVYLDLICDAFAPSDGIPLTIKSLDSLVIHCPFLTFLAIEFDAEKLEFDVEDAPAGGACNRLVYELDVGLSPLDPSRVAHVAAHLSSLFPNLQLLCFQGDIWGHVQETARLMMARIRQHERLSETQTAPWKKVDSLV